MQRNEKQEMVGALHAMMAKANFAAAVAYKNIDAEATVKLRRTFRDAKVDYKVVKNTLARLARAPGNAAGGHFRPGQQAGPPAQHTGKSAGPGAPGKEREGRLTAG